jgi:uncharacterized protein
VGSVAGYSSDVLVDAGVEDDDCSVVASLLCAARGLADRHARSMALMYASHATMTAALRSHPGATAVLTSANTAIDARRGDFNGYLDSFPQRRRANLRREISRFRESGGTLVELRLSECLDVVGPMLGNVHRKHGAADTDADTTRYLSSQADLLDDVSRVFLHVVDGRPASFSLSYQWGRQLHVRVVGFDYVRSASFAYFNLAYYRPLACAVERGLDSVHLGPGTYAAKVLRGAALDPTWSLVWAPDAENGAWFRKVQQPGADAREAAPWLPGKLRQLAST